ncbi:MAG: tetratricopeptide repeat protein [Planctomycetales bacterium]|nr:tetratricopeptide repeat protein [Planctomycetales bacterium]
MQQTESQQDNSGQVAGETGSRQVDDELISKALELLKTSPPEAVQMAERRLAEDSAGEMLPQQRAQFCWIAGSGLCLRGNHAEALKFLIEAESLSRELMDSALLRRTLRFKAAACLETGDYQSGSDAAREGLEISDELQDQTYYPALLHNELATNEARLQHYETSITHFRLALEIATRLRNSGLLSMLHHNLAEVLTDFGRFEEAAIEYETVLASARASENSFMIAASASNLGKVEYRLGNLEKARALLEEALELSTQGQWLDFQIICHLGLGSVSVAEGDRATGRKHFENALSAAEATGSSVSSIEARQELAELDNQTLQTNEKLKNLTSLFEQAENIGDVRQCLELAQEISKLAEANGDPASALAYARIAETKIQAVRDAEDNGELERLKDTLGQLNQQYESSELKNRDALHDAQIRAQTELAVVLALSLIFISMCTIALWMGYRSRSKLAQELRVAGAQLVRQRDLQLELQQRVAEQDRIDSLNVMAAGVAHDFNNLLTAINGSAELGQLYPDVKRKNDMFEQVASVSLRAADLTKQLIQFLGRRTIEEASTEVVSCLRKSLGMLQALCHTHNQSQLIFDCHLQQAQIPISDMQLQQIVVNLVTNASEANPTGGHVTLRLSCTQLNRATLDRLLRHEGTEPGDFVRICVYDEGEGLTVAVRQRMFDPYFSTRGRARGLGLSSVQGIVRSCNGAIDVHSISPEGTEICVYLPLIPDSCEEILVSSPDNPLATTWSQSKSRLVELKTVLLVDDDPDALATTAELLRTAGKTVVAANSALEALARVEQEQAKIGCVVTDQSMPNHPGTWLVCQLRQRWPDLPIILFSGCVDSTVLADASVNRFLQKPFKASDLIEAVESLMGKGNCAYHGSHNEVN